MKIFEINGELVNSDNDENDQLLIGRGAVEIPLETFAGQEDDLKYLSPLNTELVNGTWVFTLPVKTAVDLLNEHTDFFNSEKETALRVDEDYRLELEPITESEMNEVKAYLQAIKPSQFSDTFVAPSRPALMSSYDAA